MSKEPSRITLDGELYDANNLSENAQEIIRCLDRIKVVENEKKNMIAILTKAKKAYMGDLKGEMISAKAGFDFSE